MREKILTPMKAIRTKCLDCSCGLANEVRLCPIKECSLYPYRFGKNPNRAGIGGKRDTNIDEEISSEKTLLELGISEQKHDVER